MKVAIIGSGPAAAAAALALRAEARCEIEIFDVGETLEPERQKLLEGVGSSEPSVWPHDALRELRRQPASEVKGELPQKWVFGSDFPFRDAGQLEAVTSVAGGNTRAISGAFGGFSNAWGAQVLPYTRETLDEWACGYDALVPHYRAVLAQIPFSGADDDYSERFPLLADATPLPRLAAPAARVLSRYQTRRARIRRRGVTLGEARLAMSAPSCIECGLCLTGCPYGLIYSSAQTLSALLERRALTYRGGVLVLRVGEDAAGCWIETRNLESGLSRTHRADRVLLACGGLGTTRLVANSIRRDAREVILRESVQFVIPFLSAVGGVDPRTYSTFTLNQVNMLIEYGRPGLDLAHVHLYPYNPTFTDALPPLLRRFDAGQTAILRRVVAGLGYLPSWASPALVARLERGREDALPRVELSARRNPATAGVMARVLGRLAAAAPALDLWPVIPSVRLSGPAKSYHFGGSFPHVTGRPRPGGFETDHVGRPSDWSRIHLLDGSVFPSVAATTFTLTVMANAHRIATAVARGTA